MAYIKEVKTSNLLAFVNVLFSSLSTPEISLPSFQCKLFSLSSVITNKA